MEIKQEILDKISKGSATLKELKKIKGLKGSTRQNIHYHIKTLCEKNIIRPHIKGTGLKDEEIFYTLSNNEHPITVLNLINEMCGNDVAASEQAASEFVNLYIRRVETSVNIKRKQKIESTEKQIQWEYDEDLKRYGTEGRPDLLKQFSSIEAYKKYLKDNSKKAFESRISFEENKLKEEVQNAKQEAIRLAHALMCGASQKEKVAFSLTCKNEDGSYNLVKYQPAII